jgi:hypothetical protein
VLLLLVGLNNEEEVLPMEPPSRFWASLWYFIKFLPYFFGLFLLGLIKGDMLPLSPASFGICHL